jgi:serine/threonine-protein kinase
MPAVKTEPSSGPLVSDKAAVAKQDPLAAGSIIDNKYKLMRVLGEGGMGIVYLAEDIHSGIQIVLKAMRPELSHRKDVRERTLAEGRTLARIDHPNVVHLNAIVADHTGLWLVMQYIDGESLDKTIKRYRGENHFVSFTVAMDIFRQILDGVAAAHRDGVIHRDLKPANVLVRRKDGVAKVTDFGIAKPEEQARVGQGNTKGVIGSLWYMSPEQVQGRRDLDKRLDIYALGILLFELLTGSVPFQAESSYEIMRLHVEEPLPRVLERRKDAPAWVDRILARACAKKREDRYHSCEEFLADIDREMGAGLRPAAGATRILPSIPAPEPTQSDDEKKPAAVSPTTKPPAPKPTTQHVKETAAAAEAPSSAAQTSPDAEGSSRLPKIAVALALVVAAGVGGYFLLGRSDSKPKQTPQASSDVDTEPSAPTEPAASASSIAASTRVRPADVMATLVGRWKSEGGTDFDAVRVGDTVEFRVVDPAQFAPVEYAVGEARFTLRLGTPAGTFKVEETMRPFFKEPFDPKARTTCQEIWSEVEGKPLLATLDGESLRVDFARATFSPSMAVVKDGKVVKCQSLRGSVAGRGRTTLKRQP